VKKKIAGHFKKEIPPEEDTGAHGVNAVAEAERVEHLQLRKSHIDTIQIRDHVAEKQQRQDALQYLSIQLFFGLAGYGGCRRCLSKGWHWDCLLLVCPLRGMPDLMLPITSAGKAFPRGKMLSVTKVA
jgi:hypothetical protein